MSDRRIASAWGAQHGSQRVPECAARCASASRSSVAPRFRRAANSERWSLPAARKLCRSPEPEPWKLQQQLDLERPYPSSTAFRLFISPLVNAPLLESNDT